MYSGTNLTRLSASRGARVAIACITARPVSGLTACARGSSGFGQRQHKVLGRHARRVYVSTRADDGRTAERFRPAQQDRAANRAAPPVFEIGALTGRGC